MPGSRRNFAYTDDGGGKWVVNLDESTYENLLLGFDQDIAGNIYNDLARRLKVSSKTPIALRYMICKRVDGDGRTVVRKVYVGNNGGLAWGNAGTTITLDDGSYFITSKVGEVRTFLPGTDTGLIDGDVDNEITSSTP